MRVVIASDHAGYDLKAELAAFIKELGHEVEDVGTHDTCSVDYPDFGHALAKKVLEEGCKGVLICGTGIGISIAANRHPGVRAALCTTMFHAMMARQHNDANVVALGARVTGGGLACEIVRAFLETEFEGGRHQRRIDKIEL